MFSKESIQNEAHVLDLKIRSTKIRKLLLESITNAGSGHPGGSLSTTDILTALYFGKLNGNSEKNIMDYDPKDPNWALRDKLILSKGHAAPALYATLAYAGFLDKDHVRNDLRRIDSNLQGHPSMRHTPGVDFSTGSLGQGISAAVGIALSGKERGLDYKVYSILGDGEMQEGQTWEALLTIPNKKLNNLCVIIDCNGIQIDGTTREINDLSVIENKLREFKFDARRVSGHMYEPMLEALREEKLKGKNDKPVAIIAYTIKGKGVTFIEDNEDYHGKALSAEELRSALDGFDKTIDTLGKKRASLRFGEIEDTLERKIKEKKTTFIMPSYDKKEIKEEYAGPTSTRKAYAKTLLHHLDDPRIFIVNADLSKSLMTDEFAIKQRGKRTLNVGVQEQNMMSIAAGLASTGYTVFTNSFAVFTERGAEQIRNSIAYPKMNVKVVGSHGGLATGPDGASHQAVEDIGFMTSIPDLVVIEPGDAYQTGGLVEKMIEDKRPTYLRLGRNNLPLIFDKDQKFEIGKGYQLTDGNDITIVSAGLTYLAMDAYEKMKKKGINARVINMPTIKPIESEIILKAARETKGFVTIEDHNVKNGLGAAVHEVLGMRPAYLQRIGSQDRFGKSARDHNEIYEKYGITIDNIIDKSIEVIKAYDDNSKSAKRY